MNNSSYALPSRGLVTRVRGLGLGNEGEGIGVGNEGKIGCAR